MRVTEKRKKEMGDKGLKRERNKSNGFACLPLQWKMCEAWKKRKKKSKSNKMLQQGPIVDREGKEKRKGWLREEEDEDQKQWDGAEGGHSRERESKRGIGEWERRDEMNFS